MKTVAFHKYITLRYARDIIKRLASLGWRGRGPVCLDLSRSQSIDSFGMTVLTATITKWVLSRRRVEITRPSYHKFHEKLRRVGFYRYFDLPPASEELFRWGQRGELKHVGPDALDKGYIDGLVRVLGGAIELSDDLKSLIKMSLSELMINASEHGHSELGSFVCADRFEAKNEARISVTDLGIGFRRSISRNPTYRYLKSNPSPSAILAALEEGASGPGKDPTERGLGLGYLRSLVRATGGCLSILSHDGHVNFWASKTEPHRLTKFLPITSVTLRVKIDRRRRYMLPGEKPAF